MKIGGRVPFLALKSGLQIVDMRVNDRLPHAFPPYDKPSEHMAISELQGWRALVNDPGYRSWLSSVMVAGGGKETDGEAFLKLLPSYDSGVFGGKSDLSFVWLLNPVLMITIARKGGRIS